MIANAELVLLEEQVWLLVNPVGIPIYDFDFRLWFRASSPVNRPEQIQAVARVGALPEYGRSYEEYRAAGITLINSPEDYRRATQLDCWYPLLVDLTPRTICFQGRPALEQVKAHFDWPIFMKGARQTSRHQRHLSIIESDTAFEQALAGYVRDPILGWQDVVCREFISLRPVASADSDPTKIARSFEFRTFWWKGRLAGAGRYWWEGPAYDWTSDEQAAALQVAGEAARRVAVPFLVVDVAQTATGSWIVIECNDGQESGYAGVPPLILWQNILGIEKELASGH